MHALEGVLDLVPAHSRADAWLVLEQEAANIDLIISTIAFDESRMVEFLQAVKADAEYSRIPFLCTRVLPTILSDHLVTHMRQICKELGAVDLIDVANLPREKANGVVRAAVNACLGPGSANA
jgi:response regulator RpfG family c-di-GMP phosphodiesterase